MLTLNKPEDAKKHLKATLGFPFVFALQVYVKFLVEKTVKERGCRCNE